MRSDPTTELEQFLHGDLDPACFHHADHVCTAFEILRRHEFMEAAEIYSRGLKQLAQKAGRPGGYHETITFAFLSLIAERLVVGRFTDFESFAAANPDLMEKSALVRWYAPERLNSEIARKTFVLPDPRAAP